MKRKIQGSSLWAGSRRRISGWLWLSFLLICIRVGHSQSDPLMVPDSLAQDQWVEARYAAMSLDDKIGQLFMVLVASNQGKSQIDRIKTLIRDEHIGGVIFSKGGPMAQAKLTNDFQALAKTPLLIAMDAEWGLSMRLDSTYVFPWNMTLGAITQDSIVAKVGQRIGVQAHRLGVHINFAPDLDLNTNPDNPIIGNRSFGEDRANVSRKGIAYAKGLEEAGVLSCGKHFPGHGDTSVDSHKAMPVIPFDRQRLDSVELYPFRRAIDAGISSIMVAHLSVPALELDADRPASLSEQIISGILKEEMGFKGLVFTDALDMKGATDFGKDGEVEVSAFLAGNDVLLMPLNVIKAKEKLKRAYERGRISERRLAESVKKILKAKYKVGLDRYVPVSVSGLRDDLHTVQDDLVYEEAIENAITVVKNRFDLMGLRNLENKKIAYVKFGDASGRPFITELDKYMDIDEVNSGDLPGLLKKLKDYNLVIVGFHKSNDSPWKAYKFSQKEISWLGQIADQATSNLILTVFTKPYALADIPSFDKIDGVVMAYQNSAIAQERTAQIIFGALPAKGKLPVTAHPEFPVGTGIQLPSLKRLGYSFPERVGMSSTRLAAVDSLVKEGLDSQMFPGAQVLVARKGKVVYEKSFGKPTYNANDSITNDDIYDLASLTKILATLPVVMKMEEDGKIKLNETFGELLPSYADTDLKNVTVLKALSHYGRLPSWIAFYLSTLDQSRHPSREFYRDSLVPGFSIKVADHLYLSNAYTDSIYNRIGRQSLKSNRYRYSDLAYYVMKRYIEKAYGKGLDQIVQDFLYKPLGADYTTYNPLTKFPRNVIVPSEEDDYYRYQTVQGYVHDMGAAMQGGVGGHAGLFSNANDVAKIMQMYLQGGYYGGKRFLEARTVNRFNTCYFCDKDVRRGVGFDKPQLGSTGPTCGCVSRKSFGHSGFTGTFTWADPEEEIVYVFLSNRTYPSASNTLLVKSGLRSRIQQAIYDSIIR